MDYGLGSAIFFISYSIFQVRQTAGMRRSTCRGRLTLTAQHTQPPLPPGESTSSVCQHTRCLRRLTPHVQIPSNVAFIYAGGPLMLGLIAVGWGLVASSMAAVHNTATFLTVRFLLGIAEAGTVPGEPRRNDDHRAMHGRSRDGGARVKGSGGSCGPQHMLAHAPRNTATVRHKSSSVNTAACPPPGLLLLPQAFGPICLVCTPLST